MATRFLKISSNGNKILKSKLMKVPSYMIIFNFSFPFSLAEFEKDPSKYTQSLGCWHGFIAQQVMISVKKHFGTTKRKYLYLSGWMVAAMRSQFGPLPDQVSERFIR